MSQLALFIECATGQCGCYSHNGFLTRAGYDALDMADSSRYLDKVGSVSALELERDITVPDDMIDQQYRRFLNGS